MAFRKKYKKSVDLDFCTDIQNENQLRQECFGPKKSKTLSQKKSRDPFKLTQAWRCFSMLTTSYLYLYLYL